jgi:hypothetical protein
MNEVERLQHIEKLKQIAIAAGEKANLTWAMYCNDPSEAHTAAHKVNREAFDVANAAYNTALADHGGKGLI